MNKLYKYIGNLEQLAYARRMKMTEGHADGLRVIEVNNGNGLQATILEGRGLDIGRLSINGINMGFLSKAGLSGPASFTPVPGEMQRYFYGGMLTTCGLSNIGPNQMENGAQLPMHGRIGITPANNVVAKVDYEQGHIVITGTMIQAALFGQNLHMERKIVISMEQNKLSVSDKVINNNYDDELICVMYHINFGYPMLSESTKLNTNCEVPEPKTKEAKNGLEKWRSFEKPTDNRPEECFFHFPIPNDDGVVHVDVHNESIKTKACVSYKKAQMPVLIEWKSMASGDYALGIEPSTSRLMGKLQEAKDGRMVKISSGSAKSFGFELSFTSL